ncbi:hypothetical protein BDV93DRAFT_513325 [Ceratobasidium sp. AG-I]|nr:hypothetical protein BDV93DRAFT_513325 [Ceratobasidium sp. AG-I]
MSQTPTDVRLSQEAFDSILNSYARAQAASNSAVLQAVRTAGDVFGRIQSPGYNRGGKPSGKTHRKRKAKAREQAADPGMPVWQEDRRSMADDLDQRLGAPGSPSPIVPGAYRMQEYQPRSPASQSPILLNSSTTSVKREFVYGGLGTDRWMMRAKLVPIPTIETLLQGGHGTYGYHTGQEVQGAINDLLTGLSAPTEGPTEAAGVPSEDAPPAPAYTPAPATISVLPADPVPTTNAATLPASNSTGGTWEELDYEMDEPGQEPGQGTD